MNDSSSIISSLIDDDLKSHNSKNESKKPIVLALLSQLVWVFVGIQLKTVIRFFPNDYSNSSLTCYRSISLLFLGYYFAKKNNIEITPISKVQNKFWFFTRNIGIFISLMLWVTMNQYLRLSTCQCISGCYPIIVLYLSVIILKEKFYSRYLVGIIFCLFGTAIIVFNEQKSGQHDDKAIDANVLKGMIIGVFQLFISSAAVFAQKFLINEKILGEVQCYYLGLFQMVLGFICMILTNQYGITNILYILYSFSNGILVYLGTYITTESLKDLPISKFMPITYISTVYVFILGFLVLGEPLYFSDLLGGSLIVGFQLYNILIPLK